MHPGTVSVELDEVKILREGVGGVGVLMYFHHENTSLHAPVLNGERLNGNVSGTWSGFAVVYDCDGGCIVFVHASGTERGIPNL